jgi:SAM-dependent methyltransferase
MQASDGRQGYRDSHVAPGYGACYEASLTGGYYGELWLRHEMPLLRTLCAALREGSADLSVLDFACGTGRIAAVLAQHFERVQRVDVSAEMLSVAANVVPKNVETIRGDITTDSGLCKGPYDIVTAFRFFMNADDELREAAMRAIAVRQRVGSFLIMNVQCNGRSPLGWFHRIKARLGRETQRTMTLSEARRALEASSYVVVSVHRYGLFPRLGGRDWPGQSFFIRAAEVLLRVVPLVGAVAQCFMVVAIKAESR